MYKRQGFVNKVCAEFQKLAGVTAGDAEATENEAVSYTHLDVYKRQYPAWA